MSEANLKNGCQKGRAYVWGGGIERLWDVEVGTGYVCPSYVCGVFQGF